MTSSHRKVRRAALLGGAALLGAHFVASALSQAPLSPAKVRYHETVSSYLDPYFSQNWMLFAPDPLMEDRGIISRARCSDGSVSDFHDVTGPYIQKAQESRFFPSRMSRIVTNGVQQLNYSDDILNRLREQERSEDRPLTPRMEHEKKSEEEATRTLAKYSLDQMDGICGGAVDQVQFRMYIYKHPPWSQRNDPSAEGETQAIEFDWQDVEGLR